MNPLIPYIVTLDFFEGPFDFLVHLIQKCEIEPTTVSLHKIIKHYLQQNQSSLDSGAEFVGTAASLLWLKSKSLLPQTEQPEEDEDPSFTNFDLVNQLVEYCRIKQAAKELSHLEQHQSAFYSRGYEQVFDPKKNLGIEHISLNDLASLFQQVLSRIKDVQGNVQDEDWKVSDKIFFLRSALKHQPSLLFYDLFKEDVSRLELIVLFLAILELMKLGEIRVVRDQMEQVIITTRLQHE